MDRRQSHRSQPDELPSYAAQGYWELYQPMLPPELRTRPQDAPREEWWQWRGHQIHLDRSVPPVRRPIRVLLIHGGGGNGRMLLPAARMLCEAGYEVLAPDLPGFGLTQVDWQEAITFPLWMDCLEDLLREEMRQDPRPFVAFGMSIGGLGAYNLAARCPQVVGVIATMLNDPRQEEVRDAFARSPALLGPGMKLLGRAGSWLERLRLPMRWFSDLQALANDPRLQEIITRDPLVGGVRMQLGFLRSLLEEAIEVEPEDYAGAPILLAHPGADRWTPEALSRRFVEQITGAPTTIVSLENAGHFPIERPGVDQMREAIEAFLQARCQQLEGSAV